MLYWTLVTGPFGSFFGLITCEFSKTLINNRFVSLNMFCLFVGLFLCQSVGLSAARSFPAGLLDCLSICRSNFLLFWIWFGFVHESKPRYTVKDKLENILNSKKT